MNHRERYWVAAVLLFAVGFVVATVGMLLGAHPNKPVSMIGLVLMAVGPLVLPFGVSRDR